MTVRVPTYYGAPLSARQPYMSHASRGTRSIFTSSPGNSLVRSVKTALATTLKERSPCEEVLQTLLLEAEYIVNSRPLTKVDTEPTEADGLTPNFLIAHTCDDS
ncbi:hypothetical protein EVAR_42103_1 [Eumeta japonica]|uniref:Uncharacterized protein n=1 Tax=Eumeta variegata TaxID=151549 RepID=A0A4C1XJ81_EUMVA|nr:hypothetical protein EVAR_42103_1 [Eumeta japonica]